MDHVFRNNIYNVTDERIDEFIDSIDEGKLSLHELKFIIDDINTANAVILFFIDFDKKLFVNGFADIEVEKCLPDISWKGEQDDPVNYLSENIRKILKK